MNGFGPNLTLAKRRRLGRLSFERCLFAAVLEDGDRDTVGAMACAIAGAHLGEGALPPSWRAKLEGLERVEATAKALAEARARPG
jgi:ADP-ribosylglycohydrolase